MKANFFKVFLMTIAICTAASNIALAQGRHGGGHHNGARIENKGHHGGPQAQPKAHGGHHAMPKAHGGPHFHDGHHAHGPHYGGHAYRAPRHRFGHRHHSYFVVRHPRPLPPYVRYRAFDVAPAIGAILTELPLHAVEVLIDDITYYSAMGLLFRPFYVDNVMHFEVMNPF